jgi:hypothetical protein
MNLPQTINQDTLPNAIQEIENRFFDIPFENSQFQNENFVINAQLTPARAYRSIGLRLMSKFKALNEAYFGRQLEDVDLAELEEKKSTHENKYERMRAEIEINKRLSNRSYTDKLINDALKEVNYLYGELQKYPQYTREQFELEEKPHFEQKLIRQANGIQGATESLMNMGSDGVKLLEQVTSSHNLLANTNPLLTSD